MKSVAVTPTGDTSSSGSNAPNPTVVVWDLATGQCLHNSPAIKVGWRPWR